jgi:hypothetical protein
VVDLDGEFGGGEPAWGWGQGERGGQGGPDPRLVQVDAGDPAGSGLGGQRQLIEDAVGQEPDVGAVQRGGEPVSDPREPGDDLGEVLRLRRQRNYLALWTVASKRSTCSPLV